MLEVFKNTLPTRLYWVLFPIEDLRQAVETAKRILTKERNVLTSMMNKLTAQNDNQNKQFKSKIYHSKQSRQMGNFYDQNDYDQKKYQDRYRSNSGDRRISFSGRIQYGQNYRDRLMYNQNYRGDFKRGNFKGNLQSNQNYRGQNYRGGHRRNYRNDNYETGVGLYSGNTRRNDRSSSRSRSGLKASANKDRIRCYKCSEYDHFSKDCQALKVEKEAEQIQQMYNMDEKQTTLKTLATGTYDSLNRINSIDETAVDNLNL